MFILVYILWNTNDSFNAPEKLLKLAKNRGSILLAILSSIMLFCFHSGMHIIKS